MDETSGHQVSDPQPDPPAVAAPEGGGGGEETRSDGPCVSCLRGCWHMLSWLLSILTYLAELFVIGWASWYYASRSFYILLSITLAYVALPIVVLIIVSLVWYADLDRFYRKKREEGQSENPLVKQYKKQLTIGASIVHVLCLGLVYRYGQLIYLLLARRTTNLKFLLRDAALLRFLHGLLITAPQTVIHLYVVSLSANPDESFHTASDIPLIALGTCMVSLAYTILAFTTSDRLSGKDRRVVFVGHLLQIMWYACLLAVRIIAFGLFAHAYGLYVFVIVAAHWILVFFGILRWRTTFCSDTTGNEIKSRWYLEVPFDFIAACVYIFVFFNLKEGRTRFPSLAYHVLVFVENAVMVSLFFVDQRGLSYSPASIPVVVGLFLFGVCLMLLFYWVFHPRKTFEWYWIGIPRKLCGCCKSDGDIQESTDSVELRLRAGSKSVNISGPTLVSMNGAIPELSVKFGDQSFRKSSGSGLKSGQTQFGTPPSETEQTLTSPPLEASQPVSSPFSPSSPPPLSPPELEDKSIDSPMSFLAETSPSTYQRGSDTSHYDTLASARSFSPPKDDDGPLRSPGSRSEGSEYQEDTTLGANRTFVRKPPTPYPVNSPEEEEEEEVEEGSVSYPYFSNIPAKKPDYHTQRTQLEQHYFPEKGKPHVSSPQITQSRPQASPQKPQGDPEYFHFPSPTHQMRSGNTGPRKPSNQQAPSSPSRRNRGYSGGQTSGSPERRRARHNQPHPPALVEKGGGGGREGQRRNPPLYGQVYTPERSQQADTHYSSVTPRSSGVVGPTREAGPLLASYGVNLNTGHSDKFQDVSRTLQGSLDRSSRPHWTHSVPARDPRPLHRASWSADRAYQRDRWDVAVEGDMRPRTYSEGSNRSPQHARRANRGQPYGFSAPQGRSGRDVLPPDWATRYPPDITFTHRSPQVARVQSTHPSLYRSERTAPPPQNHTPRSSLLQDYQLQGAGYGNHGGNRASYHGNRDGYHGNRYSGQWGSHPGWTKASPLLRAPTMHAPVSQV